MITDIDEELKEVKRLKDLNDWINDNPSLPYPIDEVKDEEKV